MPACQDQAPQCSRSVSQPGPSRRRLPAVGCMAGGACHRSQRLDMHRGLSGEGPARSRRQSQRVAGRHIDEEASGIDALLSLAAASHESGGGAGERRPPPFPTHPSRSPSYLLRTTFHLACAAQRPAAVMLLAARRSWRRSVPACAGAGEEGQEAQNRERSPMSRVGLP